MKEINLQLFLAALCHVIWLSVDMLSFNNILPVLAERLLRDVPCWIFVSVMFHYLSIWFNANNAMKLGSKEHYLFNRRNVYLFQALSVLVDVSLRITQQVYNNPALFSLFEGVYMVLLSLVSLLFVVLCHFLLYQARSIAHESRKNGGDEKISRFYNMMIKFYLIMAPGGLLFVVLGFCLVGTRIIYLPIVIAAEHLWTIALHFFSWASLNLILWKFSFGKKKSTKTSTNATNSVKNTNTSSSNQPVSNSITITNDASSPSPPEGLGVTFSHESTNEE